MRRFHYTVHAIFFCGQDPGTSVYLLAAGYFLHIYILLQFHPSNDQLQPRSAMLNQTVSWVLNSRKGSLRFRMIWSYASLRYLLLHKVVFPFRSRRDVWESFSAPSQQVQLDLQTFIGGTESLKLEMWGFWTFSDTNKRSWKTKSRPVHLHGRNHWCWSLAWHCPRGRLRRTVPGKSLWASPDPTFND